jgi:hypothetical protein
MVASLTFGSRRCLCLRQVVASVRIVTTRPRPSILPLPRLYDSQWRRRIAEERRRIAAFEEASRAYSLQHQAWRASRLARHDGDIAMQLHRDDSSSTSSPGTLAMMVAQLGSTILQSVDPSTRDDATVALRVQTQHLQPSSPPPRYCQSSSSPHRVFAEPAAAVGTCEKEQPAAMRCDDMDIDGTPPATPQRVNSRAEPVATRSATKSAENATSVTRYASTNVAAVKSRIATLRADVLSKASESASVAIELAAITTAVDAMAADHLLAPSVRTKRSNDNLAQHDLHNDIVALRFDLQVTRDLIRWRCDQGPGPGPIVLVTQTQRQAQYRIDFVNAEAVDRRRGVVTRAAERHRMFREVNLRKDAVKMESVIATADADLAVIREELLQRALSGFARASKRRKRRRIGFAREDEDSATDSDSDYEGSDDDSVEPQSLTMSNCDARTFDGEEHQPKPPVVEPPFERYWHRERRSRRG